jgi:dTDP-4-amino-4,6-dideoxygalactose transaminase
MSELIAIAGGPPSVSAEHRRWPQVGDSDRKYVQAVLDRGVFCGPFAPEVTAVQEEWSAYCGTRFALAVNTGTAALHCAAAAVDLRPGDEVIVPAFTFAATAFGMAHQGAVPVFCDVQPDTFNVDPARIRERISGRTKAIVPVHMHGLPADMTEINAIAAQHGIPVIEDAAQAHGAQYKGRRVGALADVGCFSLNATKNLSGGEGGLLTTDNERIHSIARHLAIFGEDVVPLGPGEFRAYRAKGLGWNYRASELPIALARAQLLRLDEHIAIVRRNAGILTEGLAAIPGLVPPFVPEDRTSVYHKYRVRIDPVELGYTGPVVELRDRLVWALNAENVRAVLWHTEPVPAHLAFRRPLRTWTPEQDAVPVQPWDPGEYPVASHLLDASFLLGSELEPLLVQDVETMHQYVGGCAKVIRNLDVVLEADYVPPRFR